MKVGMGEYSPSGTRDTTYMPFPTLSTQRFDSLELGSFNPLANRGLD
jgi:hypothetical protein